MAVVAVGFGSAVGSGAEEKPWMKNNNTEKWKWKRKKK